MEAKGYGRISPVFSNSIRGGVVETQRLVFIYIIGCLCVFSGAALADKVYRVVGSDGKISFTDKDPQTVNSGAVGSSEEIEVKEGYSSKERISQIGSVSYCGSIALPARVVYGTNFYGQVSNINKSWLAEMSRIDQSMSQLTSGHVSSRYSGPGGYTVDNLKRLSELNCATDWAQQQKRNAIDEKLALQRKSDGLNTYLQELSAGSREICGDEPIYSSEDRLFEDKRSTWKKCVSDHSNKIQDVQSDLKQTDALLYDIKQIEDMR